MISVHQISKRYDDIQALKEVSFEIGQGEFYGLLGPNGAGKTTTISILSTLLPAESGKVTIDGIDIQHDPIACKKRIGIVPQEIALYNEMSAMDNLLFWGGLYDVPTKELKQRIDRTLHLFGLHDRRKDKVKTYSGGMKRRINIASAILHSPKVLILDEPTVGIDPQSRNLIFEVLEQLHQEGMTIIYTTHYMEEVERLAQRIGIIDHGTLIAQGTIDELKKQSDMQETIVVTCEEISDAQFQQLHQPSTFVTRNEQTLSFTTNAVKQDLSRVIMNCHQVGLDISNIEIQKVNLETVFLHLTGKQLRE